MTQNLINQEAPAVHVQADKEDVTQPVRSTSRSPHPYHRRKFSSLSITQQRRSPSTADSALPQQSLNSTPPSSPSDHDEVSSVGHRRDLGMKSKSPSDSGTEADDESFRFLKGLPAPPLRPKKGLKNCKDGLEEGTLSPLLTPSFLKKDERKFPPNLEHAPLDEAQAHRQSEEERGKIRARFNKSRQAELIRRGSEVVLLGSIGGIVHYANYDRHSNCGWYKSEVLSSFLTILALFVVYPLRLWIYSRQSTVGTTSSVLKQNRIPSSFDPAPILYPPLLPIYVSLSLLPTNQQPLLTNCILSLASLPPELIPLFYGSSGFSATHWLVSIIPLITFRNTALSSQRFPTKPNVGKISPRNRIDSEMLICLYPLHRALLPVLEYLTTTSLLPAELQLLSISLINVLLHSTSPQAVILKALIWGGGISIFVLCGHVFRWGVVLARVPRWRFRRAGQAIRARNAFLGVLSDGLKRPKIGRISLAKGTSGSSSSGAEDNEPLVRSLSMAKGGPVNDVYGTNGCATTNGMIYKPAAAAAVIDSSVQSPAMNGSAKDDASQFSNHQRRHTLPTYERLHAPPKSTRTPSGRRKRMKSTAAKSYLSLTADQATVRKWIYAFYVYGTIIFILLVVIRSYIGATALNNNEPIGWALGYLFGNIQWFRLWAISSPIERWLCLPIRNDCSSRSCQLGVVERLRRVTFGVANTRLLICGYWAGVLSVGMAIVLRLSSVVEVDTRRKVFHGMMVAMFLPVIYLDPVFAGLALILVLAVFLLLDLFRASQLPPLSKPLAYFLTPYVDGRDLRGPVVVSHIFLLIGCAIPLWLSLAGVDRAGMGVWEGWDVNTRDISMVSGIICVGMGDAAASLIGRRYGRRKWLWSGGKSLEGSVAFVAAVTLGLGFAKAWLKIGGWAGDNDDAWSTTCWKAVVAACGASLTEAVLTGGNDNVIVPIILWLLVRGLGL